MVRDSALLVLVLVLVLVGGVPVGSGDDAEAAGPRDLLGGGQGDLEEAEGLELAGAAQGPGVDGLEAAAGDDAGHGRLRVGVVAGDEDGGGEVADGPGGQGSGEGGVEGLHDSRLGQCGGQLGGGRAAGGDGERVERLEVQRVRDVHDDPAREVGTARGDDVGEGGVGDGQ